MSKIVCPICDSVEVYVEYLGYEDEPDSYHCKDCDERFEEE